MPFYVNCPHCGIPCCSPRSGEAVAASAVNAAGPTSSPPTRIERCRSRLAPSLNSEHGCSSGDGSTAGNREQRLDGVRGYVHRAKRTIALAFGALVRLEGHDASARYSNLGVLVGARITIGPMSDVSDGLLLGPN